MAIDTRNKRGSVISLGILTILPLANSDIDAGDRQQLSHIYRGIASDTPSPPGPTGVRTWLEFFIKLEGLDSVSVNDKVMEYTALQGADGDQFNHVLDSFLENKGYVGALNDKLDQWKEDGFPA